MKKGYRNWEYSHRRAAAIKALMKIRTAAAAAIRAQIKIKTTAATIRITITITVPEITVNIAHLLLLLLLLVLLFLFLFLLLELINVDLQIFFLLRIMYKHCSQIEGLTYIVLADRIFCLFPHALQAFLVSFKGRERNLGAVFVASLPFFW